MLAQGSRLGLWANIAATVGEGGASGQAQQELVARTTASFQRTQPNEMFLEQKPWKCHRVILGVLGLGQAKHPVVLTQWTLSGQAHCQSIPDLALLGPHSDILPPDSSNEPAFLSSFTMCLLSLTTSPWLLPATVPRLVLLLLGALAYIVHTRVGVGCLPWHCPHSTQSFTRAFCVEAPGSLLPC